MSFIDIILLAVALAMDCFTVSIVSGLTSQDSKLHEPWLYRMAFLFGCFQAFMPLLGWLGIIHFQTYIEAYDHWIAFGLLAFLGIRMIKESFAEEECSFDPSKLKTQLIMAVATSIDALAIGISFACTGYKDISQLTFPLIAIGIGSFVFGVLGQHLGIHFGESIRKRIRPELLGGCILIFIGIKILFEHLSE